MYDLKNSYYLLNTYYVTSLTYYVAFLVAQTVKHLPAMQETQLQSLGWEDPLEKEMATHSSTLAWKIPYQFRLVGYSPWGRKESDTTEQLHFLYYVASFLFYLCNNLWCIYNYILLI